MAGQEYITTYTGLKFYPTRPQAEYIRIEDIAHALSLTCRGNGQVKTFFSVGQHCVNCALEAKARGLSPRMVLACLLHDASESYMSDVPRPFKQFLAQYNEMEKRLLDMIYEKYLGSALTAEEQALLKKIDDDMLYFDLKHLLGTEPDAEEPKVRIDICFDFVPFEKVEKQYLAVFNEMIRENGGVQC